MKYHVGKWYGRPLRAPCIMEKVILRLCLVTVIGTCDISVIDLFKKMREERGRDRKSDAFGYKRRLHYFAWDKLLRAPPWPNDQRVQKQGWASRLGKMQDKWHIEVQLTDCEERCLEARLPPSITLSACASRCQPELPSWGLEAGKLGKQPGVAEEKASAWEVARIVS